MAEALRGRAGQRELVVYGGVPVRSRPWTPWPRLDAETERTALAGELSAPAREQFTQLLLFNICTVTEEAAPSSANRKRCTALARPVLWLLYQQAFTVQHVGIAALSFDVLWHIEPSQQRWEQAQIAALAIGVLPAGYTQRWEDRSPGWLRPTCPQPPPVTPGRYFARVKLSAGEPCPELVIARRTRSGAACSQ
ncbi:hypothetical protein ACSNOI_07345 [Actinomadura kijaniata]|uniref:hypothetical protein n=1 Tax=Actinomadura kijaniata TaxID=46161 RepID=UPI003F1BDDC8